MGALMRAKDWSDSPLGAPEDWPQSLKIALRILLTSRYAMWMGWGEQLSFFYNDAYRPTLGIKHSWALGRPAQQVWQEIWRDIGPRIETVLETGEATYDKALLLILERSGFPEETYHTFSYSPLADDDGRIAGHLCVVTEETERVIGERRMALLRELASDLAATHTQPEVLAAFERQTGKYRRDLPFALVYLFDDEADGRARLAAATGIEAAHPPAHTPIVLESDEGPWPVRRLWEGALATVLEDFERRAGAAVPSGSWDIPPHQVSVVPIKSQGQQRPAGFLVAALNPYRRYDAEYAGFVELLTGQIASGLANARAYEAERRRAEALAELDRAKTTFFSNVSHEFRTPLALLLSPLEDALADSALSTATRAPLLLAQRNGRRLLKLVNTLLDFSRIEAGRSQPNFLPTDLATFTTQLVSVFRSAVEKAGLQLVIDCPPLGEAVYVDRDMWEKIVLNLLSNAFKFTLQGRITVRLRREAAAVRLELEDTGVGIPAHELPRIFDRFHRVEETRGRSHEGSGIGLALVAELVRIHGGEVLVTSVPEQGSSFSVLLPTGTAHLPAERIGAALGLASTAVAAEIYAEEAALWTGGLGEALPAQRVPDFVQAPARSASDTPRPRILVVDDNADMRAYLEALLKAHYEVDLVGDGVEALAALERRMPDLVLTDVMMPRLDGFGLLAALRENERTRALPVIVLSARAGEEATLLGLERGANDYLSKPFAARELLGRVRANLEMARLRGEAARLLRASEERARLAIRVGKLGTWRFAPTSGVATMDERMREIWGEPEGTFQLSLAQAMERIHPADRERVSQAVDAALDPASAGTLEIDYCIVWPNGSERWVSANGQVFFEQTEAGSRRAVDFIGTALDITERKRIEQALAGSEQRYRLLAESIPQLVWTADVGGTLLDVNGRWSQYTGFTLEQVKKSGWESVVHPEDVPGLRRQWTAASKATAYRAEGRMRRADGTYRWHLHQAMPLMDGEGRILKWFGTATDIEERKQLEAEREQLLERAEQAREAAEAANRTKDEFLAILGHELRTPLNPIIGWTQMLRRGKVGPGKHDQALEIIERNARLQTQLIDDLLDVSRIMRGSLRIAPQPTTLAGIAVCALEAVRGLAEAKQVQLIEQLETTAPLSADPTRLQQVVWNLLINAVKFTPAGGQVQVRLESGGGTARLTVSDTGAGIPAEFLPHLFERFRQADTKSTREQKGLGLGLFIVHHIVEAHGGTVQAESKGEGKGAAFTIVLPLGGEAQRQAKP